MKRPFGITLIAILALISGLFGLCWPILIFTGSAFLGSVFGTVGVIAGIFLIVGPILQLIFSYGAFNLRSWAWYLGLISTGITVIGVIVNLFNGASFWSAVWGSIFSIIIFIYLLTPNVRAAFGKGSQKPAPVAPPAPVQQPGQVVPPAQVNQSAPVAPAAPVQQPAQVSPPAQVDQSAPVEPPAPSDNVQQ